MPSALKQSERTGMAWPARVWRSLPVPTSKRATVPSMAPHASLRPSGLYVTLCGKTEEVGA